MGIGVKKNYDLRYKECYKEGQRAMRTTQGIWTPLWRDRVDIALARIALALQYFEPATEEEEPLVEELWQGLSTGDWRSIVEDKPFTELCKKIKEYVYREGLGSHYPLRQLCTLLFHLKKGRCNSVGPEYPNHLPWRPAPMGIADAEEYAEKDFDVVESAPFPLDMVGIGLRCFDLEAQWYSYQEEEPTSEPLLATGIGLSFNWLNYLLEPVWHIRAQDRSNPRWPSVHCQTYGRTYVVNLDFRGVEEALVQHGGPENESDEDWREEIKERGLLLRPSEV